MFPSISEYNQAIQQGGANVFRTHFNLHFTPSRTLPIKIFSYGSGAYAVVFKARDNVREYAIRCFITGDTENIQRYREIVKFLSNIDASWLTKIELLENEIKVKGKPYPVIKMEWVSGQLLNDYIDRKLHDNLVLGTLQQEIVNISASLEHHKIGHGDIQSGNMIVTESSNSKPIIKLIDYDGMYIPSFSNKSNLERGRSEFQHPKRLHSHFNEKMDRFSFWVILTALEALKFDKSLWKEVMNGGFNTLDNLLFLGSDFQSFSSSPLVSRLYLLNSSSLNFYLNSLKKFCNSSPESVVPPVLFDQSSKIEVFAEVEQPVEIFPSVSASNSDIVQIITSPAGAVVLTTWLSRIGVTPLKINKQEYIGKTLIINYNGQRKEVSITGHQDLIDITFPEVSRPDFYMPVQIFDNTSAEENIHNIEVETEDETPFYPSHSSSESGSLILVALFILTIIVGAVYFDNNSGTSESEQTTSQIDSIKPEPASDAATFNDAMTPMPDRKLSEVAVEVVSKDHFGMTAVEVIQKFFSALSEQDCGTAWNLTFNPIWDSRGKEWFCSSESFGSVTEIVMFEITPISQYENEAKVSVNYYAADAVNGNLCIKQQINLEKVLLSDNKPRWMITKMINLEQPYECVLTSE